MLDAKYERSAEQIATAVEMLLNQKDLTLLDPDVVLCALEQFRKRPKVGFSESRARQVTCRSVLSTEIYRSATARTA